MSAMTSDLDLAEVSRVRVSARKGEARTRRIQHCISLREMAESLGVKPSTLSRWERGEATPRPDDAVRWGAVLASLEAA
ncbi:helix-turn-helix domain-containing protein [Streptomyces sp. NPDC001812]|uniref:helix-turn-helix domain-containing protein n=1 Tax=Streptomyces sp. NPDC001812 TaxID=3364611 RepID=UPI003684185B